MSLKAEDISTWEDLSRKFTDQYRYCAETPPTLLELSTKEMARGQRFEEYAAKWRAQAVKHIPPISEAQQIQLFHSTLRGVYYSHLLAHTSSFSDLIEAGKKLDLGIKLGRMEDPTGKGEDPTGPTTDDLTTIRPLCTRLRLALSTQAPGVEGSSTGTTEPYFAGPTGRRHAKPTPQTILTVVRSSLSHISATLGGESDSADIPGSELRPVRSGSVQALRISSGRAGAHSRQLLEANPLPDHRPSSGPSINMISICALGRVEEAQENPLPFVINYTPEEITVGFTGHVASPAPFVVDIPAREPYSDSKLLAFLLGSEPHREALFRVLTTAQVPKETPPDRIKETIGSIFSNTISFLDDELPSEGWSHSRALHIVCKCNNYIIGRVMIDNGSALNVCPVTTLKQMNVDLNRVRPSKTAVRAFDGSRREVNGEIDLLIDVGPCSFSITFQFIVDERLITVKGEEDYTIYKEMAVPYISVGDDENLPFHSFETISVIRDYGESGPSRADRMIGKSKDTNTGGDSVFAPPVMRSSRPARATIFTTSPHTTGGSTGALQSPRYLASSLGLHTLSGAPLTTLPRTPTTLLPLLQPCSTRIQILDASIRTYPESNSVSPNPYTLGKGFPRTVKCPR
ncbi:hypothetical protein CRG98_017615 [Punica granatum]|uniref:Retrotransposon gag domain-containing protein n=1 Tax=Punica granatum TaxID=22663 RepID=A0A2I0K1M0_PUNGR|nr:hypothetical protein CRG98_017615 [Punica granatum]